MKRIALAAGAALIAAQAFRVCPAQNPIIQTIYTADPAPMVHDGTVYLYTGHDEDTAPAERFVMHDYRCFTTTDMVNWTQHGVVLDITKVFEWSGGDANAAQCIYRNGKYYYYVSTADRTHPGVALGVAVSDSPFGPFKDALGHALVTNDQTKYAQHSWDDLDPTVFIDDKGQAWLYWGNNACYYVQLNEDMISLKSEIGHVELTQEAFGPDYEEAPWVYQRGDRFYMLYASAIPESIRYATAASPSGPWTYGGLVQKAQETTASNHPGLIEFKGKPYLFHQTDALPNGIDKRRSVCVEPFSYTADGGIPELPMTREGVVEAAGTLDPFRQTQAETMAWAQGVETEANAEAGNGMVVSDIDNGDYIKIRSVDFGDEGTREFVARAACAAERATMDIRLDSPNGRLLATLRVKNTGGLDTWETMTTRVRQATGVHDVYLVFGGENGDLFKLDWWQFR